MSAEVARIAVVICTYNRSRSLVETLESIYSDGYDGPEAVDVVVVANACNDDTLAQLGRFRDQHAQDRLRLGWMEEPAPGKSRALNTAIAETKHDVLCFVDDDQVVEPGFLANLVAGVREFSEDDIFCGRIWPAWNGSEPSWVHAKPPYAIPIRPYPEFDLGPVSVPIPPGARLPSGGNIAVRRRVFERVGLFSCDLGPTGHNLAGGEDHDFLTRAVEAGCSVRYLPGMRQLHAIDAERMSAAYTLRKSYFRSRSSFLVKAPEPEPRLYMLRKIAGHLLRVATSFRRDRRFFYLVRLAASLGELSGAWTLSRASRRSPRSMLVRDQELLGLWALVAMGLASLVTGIWTSRLAPSVLAPVLFLAGAGTLAIVGKSLLDFSQTGPRIREEILRNYRGYTIYALARLAAWAFGILVFTGSAGTLVAFLYVSALGEDWLVGHGLAGALLGMISGTAWQFVRKLRYNPGLLVASMHYRASRLYRLWNWVTPGWIRAVQTGFAASVLILAGAATGRLVEDGRTGSVVPLWAGLAFFVSVILVAAWHPEARPTRRERRGTGRPNILLIGADTLRADRLSATNYRRALTPRIDALADAGVLFTDCYVPCARTAPSLISLLTGTWPHTHGVRDNFVGLDQAALKVEALPTLLKPLGYRSAVISDWCGADMGKFSFGFDHAEVPEDQWNLKYLIRQGPKDLRLFVSLFVHNRLGRWLIPELYYLGGVPLTKQQGRRARGVLSRLAACDEPFLLNVFYSTTHPPFASEWPWYTRYADPGYAGESKFAMARLTDPFEIIRRQGAPREEFDLDQIIDLYDGCVAAFDAEVGRLLDHLAACGLADDTIVVIYADHGMEFFEHDTWGQGNSAVGEASPKIPLVIRDPRRQPRGRVAKVVRSIDLAPTLLELCGAVPCETMDGVSLAACLSPGGECPDLDAFNETGLWIGDVPGLPDDHLRYPDLLELIEVPNADDGTLAIKPEFEQRILAAKDRMIRRGRWKLVYQPLVDGAMLRLFDVETDPQCRQDLLLVEPQVARELYAVLTSWLAQDPLLAEAPAQPT